ncbi:MAG: electron transfer flavoprotein subunit alpha/FixB family protein [Bacteroidales bacterium]|nr:electron transfer flavoprotein subunit alpha/FixB family protein [Bacteroidales bacterium]
MNNVFVYCEIEDGNIVDVSLELCTKGRKLADQLGCKLEAVVIGDALKGIESQLFPFGVDFVHVANDKRLYPYTTTPHTKIVVELFKAEKPEITLFGATSVGRDLAPRVASALGSGLTADCTSLEIGEHIDPKTKKEYKNLLYQIRPAFGGNIIATIINPDTRPQMATVREGVMKKEPLAKTKIGEVKNIDISKIVTDVDFAVKIIERKIEKSKVNIKGAQIVVAGGYGVGSKENFKLLYELAAVLGGEVAGSRAAVDAGFVEHERQIGQTGVTVRPKLYIACGISGAVQHTAGMAESSMVISINNDPNAPINTIADYSINGSIEEVLPKMIKYYKQNTK